MKVYPNPKLSPLESVPGVGVDGADLPDEEAQALLDAGLVVKSKPKSAEPADKSEDSK